MAQKWRLDLQERVFNWHRGREVKQTLANADTLDVTDILRNAVTELSRIRLSILQDEKHLQLFLF